MDVCRCSRAMSHPPPLLRAAFTLQSRSTLLGEGAVLWHRMLWVLRARRGWGTGAGAEPTEEHKAVQHISHPSASLPASVSHRPGLAQHSRVFQPCLCSSNSYRAKLEIMKGLGSRSAHIICTSPALEGSETRVGTQSWSRRKDSLLRSPGDGEHLRVWSRQANRLST